MREGSEPEGFHRTTDDMLRHRADGERRLARSIAESRVDPGPFWAGVQASYERYQMVAAGMLLAASIDLRDSIAADAAFLEAYNAHPLARWADDGGLA